MKNVISLIILLLNLNCFSQIKIEGEYYHDNNPSYVVDGGESIIYKFFKNGVFERNTDGELGEIDYAKGHYFIKNDSLILNYDLTKLKENSYHKYKLYKNLKDSIEVKINIYNFKRKPLSNINVYNQKTRYGFVTDKNGNVILKFKKQKGKKIIDFSELCCGNYSLVIDTFFNYEIDVFIKQIFEKLTAYKGDIIKYKISAITKDSIKLHNGKYPILLKRIK